MNSSNANARRNAGGPRRDAYNAAASELEVLRRALSLRARQLADEDVTTIERAFVQLHVN